MVSSGESFWKKIRKLDKVEKIKLCILWGFQGVLVIAAVVALYKGDWRDLFFLVFTLAVTFMPSMLERKLKIDYPSEFDIVILFFIMASMYLGEMHDYYYKFPWWDVLLHSVSGIIMGGIGFSVVFALNQSEKIVFDLSPGFVSLFAFSFAVAMGVVWEVFEFAMDQFWGTNMQKSGLMDTMQDLIVDCLGALLFAVIGYSHIKGNIRTFERMEKKFFKMNPELKK